VRCVPLKSISSDALTWRLCGCVTML
jgi:hypothetical protein